jgi:large subunit ribosomal protein L21
LPRERAGEEVVFAIIQSGGHQIKVVPGGSVDVDLVAANPGDQVTIQQVLVVTQDNGVVLTGAPYISNAHVVGVVEGETRGPKIRIFKKKKRKGMRRNNGFRATYTRVQIKDIVVG